MWDRIRNYRTRSFLSFLKRCDFLFVDKLLVARMPVPKMAKSARSKRALFLRELVTVTSFERKLHFDFWFCCFSRISRKPDCYTTVTRNCYNLMDFNGLSIIARNIEMYGFFHQILTKYPNKKLTNRAFALFPKMQLDPCWFWLFFSAFVRRLVLEEMSFFPRNSMDYFLFQSLIGSN